MLKKPFIREFRSFIIFFYLFGLAPISDNQRLRYILYINSFFQISLITYIFTSVTFLQSAAEESALSTIVNYLFLAGITSTHLIIMLQAFFARKEQFSLLKTFAEADVLLKKKLKYKSRYAHERHSIWLKFLIFATVLFLVKACFIYRLYFSPYGEFWIPCYYSFFILRLRCLQILFYVFLLTHRLNVVSELLSEFTCSDTFLCEKQKDFFLLDPSIAKSSKFERLLHIKQIYGKLYDINGLINDSFGWSLLVMFAQNFIGFTSYGYWLFATINDKVVDYNFAIICICLITPVIISITVLTYSCNTCSNAVSLKIF